MQIVEKIKNIISTTASDQYELDFQKEKIELQQKYNLALVEQLAIQKEMFSADNLSNALNYVKAYYAALRNYNDLYDNATFTRTKKTNRWAKYASPLFGSSLEGTKTSVVDARENMKKERLYTTFIIIGMILLLATQSKFLLSNIIGLVMVALSAYKLKLFY